MPIHPRPLLLSLAMAASTWWVGHAYKHADGGTPTKVFLFLFPDSFHHDFMLRPAVGNPPPLTNKARAHDPLHELPRSSPGSHSLQEQQKPHPWSTFPLGDPLPCGRPSSPGFVAPYTHTLASLYTTSVIASFASP